MVSLLTFSCFEKLPWSGWYGSAAGRLSLAGVPLSYFFTHHSITARVMRAYRYKITVLPPFLKEYSRTSLVRL